MSKKDKAYEICARVPTNDLGGAFITACKWGKIEEVKCLLENQEFSQYIDVHLSDDAAFAWALTNQKREVLRYLIHNYKIEKTEKIKEYLTDIGIDVINEARNMFEIRELNLELKEDLNINKNKNKSIRVKL